MIQLKKVKPLFTRIITTANVYGIDELDDIIVDTKKMQGSLKEYLTVIAVGDSVRNIKEGDLVKIDPSAYAVKRYKDGGLKDGVVKSNPVITYNFNTIEIDNKPCLLLQDRDIECVIEDYVEEKKSSIIQKDKTIIL